MNHLNMEVKIVPNKIAHEEKFEIPTEAIREILINAVCHRCLTDNSRVLVAIYDDRIEITSPGVLYNVLTLKGVLEGKTATRNVCITNVLSYLNIIENWVTGVQRAILLCKEAGIKEAKFIEMDSAIRVNFYRPSYIEPINEPINEPIKTELSKNGQKIFKTYLRQLLADAKSERLIKESHATSDFVFYTRNKNRKEIEAMDEEQAKIFFNTLITWPNIKEKALLLTLSLTGFRKGEVIGLKWDDIDFNKAKISVNRSVGNYPKYGLIIKEPKTEKSLRTITFPNILIENLKEYKTYQDNLKQKLGDYYKDENFVFSKEDGSLIGTGRAGQVLELQQLQIFIHTL